jgi:hypothetical protein
VRIAAVNVPSHRGDCAGDRQKTEDVALMGIGWASTPLPHSLD